MAIQFDRLNAIMLERGIKKFDLRKGGINASILDKALGGGNVDTKTINKLCALLSCQPGDIMEYAPDEANHTKGDGAHDSDIADI